MEVRGRSACVWKVNECVRMSLQRMSWREERGVALRHSNGLGQKPFCAPSIASHVRAARQSALEKQFLSL